MGNRREAAAQVLRVLARLAPPPTPEGGTWSIPLDWFRWLPVGQASFLIDQWQGPGSLRDPGSDDDLVSIIDRTLVGGHWGAAGMPIDASTAEGLAAVDRLRPQIQSLRVGWLFLAGTATLGDGTRSQVFQPLVTRPVRVREQGARPARLLPAGDCAITPLVEDPTVRHSFERSPEMGGLAMLATGPRVDARLLTRLGTLRDYALTLSEAAGMPATAVIPAGDNPVDLRERPDLVVVVGFAVYAVHEGGEVDMSSSLRAWAEVAATSETSFDSLYTGPDGAAASVPDEPRNVATVPLTRVQESAVTAARRHTLTVVSGAPGTGKSHTIAAIATDQVALGSSVLVAAGSDTSVDALLEAFARAPGLDPVVFGSTDRRREVLARIDQLIDPARRPTGTADLAGDELRRSTEHLDTCRSRTRDALVAEAAMSSGPLDGPSLLADDADLDEIDRLIEIATADHTLRHLLDRRAATHRLDGLTAKKGSTIAEVRVAVQGARLDRHIRSIRASGGLTLLDEWDALTGATLEHQQRAHLWLDARARSVEPQTPQSIAAMAGFAAAMSLGRAARRSALASMRDAQIAAALPLWVGSLADIDDLLQAAPGLFDVVILDEASAVDQTTAATALLRGRRAVIVGDPRQLRAVPSVTDADVDAALVAEGVEDPTLAAKLDVRHSTVLDVAIGAAPVITLDEHFRSAPHLVDFVGRRLYGGAFATATRNPATASLDCIDVVRVEGRRNGARVVTAEVDEVVSHLRRLHRQGFRNVGVVTPFRPQADALERAVLDRLRPDTRDALDLRVGTVHDFQGFERHTVVVSLGVGDGADPATWRVLEDPHLFAVMVTRARDRMVVVTSGDPPPGGLVADYLELANSPPGPPRPAGALGPWSATVLDHLTHAGIPAVGAYPSGRHVIDVCVGDEHHWFGLECEVHPDGPDAHIDRHLALRRAGWVLHDAYASRWRGREAELVIEVGRLLGSG